MSCNRCLTSPSRRTGEVALLYLIRRDNPSSKEGIKPKSAILSLGRGFYERCAIVAVKSPMPYPRLSYMALLFNEPKRRDLLAD